MRLISRIKYTYFSGRRTNVAETGMLILKLLEVKANQSYFQDLLNAQPQPRSLLALRDVFYEYHVYSKTLRPSFNKLKGYPCPMLIQMKSGERNTYFFIIKEVAENGLTYLNPYSLQWEDISFDYFQETWQGNIMLVEKGENAGETDYHRHLKEQRQRKNNKTLALISLTIILLSSVVPLFQSSDIVSAISNFSYFLLSLCGGLVTALLVWREVDAHNPVVREVCTGGGGNNGKGNCDAVLNSDAATVWGFSWGEIGFAYFAGSLLYILFHGIDYSLPNSLLPIISVLALPYIFFSVFYQWRIVGQWCRLCLLVQVVLFLQASMCALVWWQRPLDSGKLFAWTTDIAGLVLSYSIPLWVVHIGVPILKRAKSADIANKTLKTWKQSEKLFYALLEKQRKVTFPDTPLGITLGNPDAPVKLTKVCNPYCGPCAKAHQDIEMILESNPKVQIEIIFTATNRESDKRAVPARHLLAIAQKGNEEMTMQALDDWYLTPKKDYTVFANKYPMNGELKQQLPKIEKMREWCDQTKISFTPTFFVNGYELPEQYNITDLRYFLTS